MRKRADCFTLIALLMSCDYKFSVVLPHSVAG